MWRPNLLLMLLAAACVSLDLALWASYPTPRTQFPVTLLALLVSQTTLLTLWAVNGRGLLVLRWPMLVAVLVSLTTIGDRLQLWGPRDSMRLFDALVLVVAAKTAVVAGALLLLRATRGLRLVRPENSSPPGRGSEERAVRAAGPIETPSSDTSSTRQRVTYNQLDSLAGASSLYRPVDSLAGASSLYRPVDSLAGASSLYERATASATERFTIEPLSDRVSQQGKQFSLAWLFDLTAAVALSIALWRFLQAQIPRDPDTLAAMTRSAVLFVAIDALLLWAVLRQRLSWLGLIAVAGIIAIVPGTIGSVDHPLWIDCVEVSVPMTISLSASLAVIRIAGFRWRACP